MPTESWYAYDVLQKKFPEQVPAVELPQVPGSQGNIAVAVYAAPRQQQCREEKSLQCLMIHDHFGFSTAYIQDEEEEMEGIKGKNRKNSAVGNTV